METAEKRFLCNCEWMKTLCRLPDESRLKVYDAMFEFASSGKYKDLDLLGEVAFEPIKNEIERYLGNYEFRCKKNKENASKRWVKMRTHANAGNPNPNPNPNPNLFLTEESVNVKRTHAREESRYEKFMSWLSQRAPYIEGHFSHLFTEKEFEKIMSKYTLEAVCTIILSIENRADLRRKYTNLYLTTLNWLKRDDGTPK